MQPTVSRNQAIRAGGIDWAAHWRKMAEAREASRQAASPGSASRWDGRAEHFASLTRSLDATNDPFVGALRSALRADDAVLDVGAGAGRYSIAIAQGVGRVTAVEPSAGMRAQLTRVAAERGIRNIRILPSTWETAEVEPHDVVFAANVLYFVPDAVQFIQKLHHAARRACLILHRVEPRATALLPLWETIWGQPRPPEPGALDLLNLIYFTGIRADFRLAPLPAPTRYKSVDEALPEARRLLEVSPGDPTHDAAIRAFLPTVLAEHDGLLQYPPGPQMAIISWEKK
jgi:2-polyprenyl-3-methyl-5-hydroxy-6-metoxy-1,4-benzoquinol methylase